jgi:hypothetical protein
MRYATVGINRMVRLLKQVVNEAAGEKTPEARRFSPTHPELSEQLFPQVGCVEDFSRRENEAASLFQRFQEIPEAAQNFRQQGRRKRDD